MVAFHLETFHEWWKSEKAQICALGILYRRTKRLANEPAAGVRSASIRRKTSVPEKWSMKPSLAKFGMLLVISFCSGCAGVTSAIDKNMGGLNSAEPLNIVAKGTDISSLRITKRYLMSVIGESYVKCGAYERRLLLGARSTNASFDVATTVFSALATAFTPIGTVHALTASAAISSGSKTAIDTDVYENATAPLMIQAIDETYGINMDALETRLENDKNPDISYLVRIMRTHNQCSLSAASAKMQTLLSQQKTGNSTSAGASFATK